MILRRLTTAFRKQAWFTLAVRPLSAIFRRLAAYHPDDRTEVTLPVAGDDDWSQLGPLQTTVPEFR